MKRYTQNYTFISTLLLVFSASVILHLWVTKAGIGIQGDASPYILTARSLKAGQGFYILDEPMAIWAPFYPMLLAFWGFLGATIEVTARYMHAVIYGLNSVLFAVLIYINTRRHIVATIIGALFFLSSGVILFIHSIAWSESSFLLFTFISCILLLSFINSGKSLFLILSSLALGAAIATRYAGISLLPPAVLITFFLLKKPLFKRIKAIAGMVTIALTPILIWTIRNQFVVGTLADRTPMYHPRSFSTIANSFVNVFHGFILSDPGSKYIRIAELLLIALIFLFITYKVFTHRITLVESEPISFAFSIFGILFSVSYLFVLLITIYLLDAAVPVDSRLLIPVLVFLALTAFTLVYLFTRVIKKPVIWPIFLLFVVFSIRINTPSTFLQAKEMHTNGIGFNSYSWQDSSLMTFLRSEQPTSKIYSNGYNVIPVLTNIDAFTIPQLFSNNTQIKNIHLEQEIKDMCLEVKKGNAVIIYMEGISKKNLPEEEQLLEKCELPVLTSMGDGTIYGYNLHGTP